MSFKMNINLTASKVFAYLVFACGFAYAMVNKDGTVFISAATLSIGLMGFKTGATTYERTRPTE